MAGDFRAHFDDAVRAAEEARHGDSNDDEIEAPVGRDRCGRGRARRRR